MKLRINIYETPSVHDKRWGYMWLEKTSSACPFGRFEKNKWCKLGIRIYYGSRKKHLTISWGDAFGWCPIKKGACKL